MRTIAVVSQKGGAGKTTLTLQLAVGFWLRGRRTLLADIDPQRSSLEVLKMRRMAGPDHVASSGSKLFALQASASREGAEVLVIDTPAVVEDEVAKAVARADLAVMVLRPTYLDLAAAVNTSRTIRQLQKPGLIVLNQAPTARGGVEPPAVKRTIEALQLLRLPVAPCILRSRAVHQTGLERGCSAEELEADAPGGQEVARLCDHIEGLIFASERLNEAVA